MKISWWQQRSQDAEISFTSFNYRLRYLLDTCNIFNDNIFSTPGKCVPVQAAHSKCLQIRPQVLDVCHRGCEWDDGFLSTPRSNPMIFCYLSLILNFEVFYAAMPWPTSLTAMTASNWRKITSNSSTCAQLEQAVPSLRERCMHVVMMMMMVRRMRSEVAHEGLVQLVDMCPAWTSSA